MSNQINVTENFIFEFKEWGTDKEVISRNYSEISTPIKCSKLVCNQPNLHVYDVISSMIQNDKLSGILKCKGFQDGTTFSCGAFFEVSAIDNRD
ncbi:hypothetical protein [Colwellia sp. TT2012]|uniref:hypothetical protein n=1 Tax=Colwellia sp. TT2012 TaxID=1720342 RepID=UPI00070B9B2C|nr:hypothetical protein [Colwellia sp. TT2012]